MGTWAQIGVSIQRIQRGASGGIPAPVTQPTRLDIDINTIPMQASEPVRVLITAGEPLTWYSRRGRDNIGSVSSDSDLRFDDAGARSAINRIRLIDKKNPPPDRLSFNIGGGLKKYFGAGNPGENFTIFIATPYGTVTLDQSTQANSDNSSWNGALTASQWDILSEVKANDLINFVIAYT